MGSVPAPVSPFAAGRWLPWAGGAAAALLALLAVTVNLGQACVVRDTPYLLDCEDDAGRVSRLVARIAANPGDARTYVELADADKRSAGALHAAALVAPNHPQVQMLQAAAALERADARSAVAPLVNLAEYNGNDDAALVLARLVVAGQSRLLEEQLRPGTRWVERVLQHMPQAGGSIGSALPLVAKALAAQALAPAAVSNYIAQLKSARSWTDAYSLWLVLHGRRVPALYNGSFDQPFVVKGFDWEVNVPAPASRAGAIVDRAGADNRGAVLDIRFTGRAIALPMVRQYVFIGDGRHRIKGEYKSFQLRIEQGLAWTVRCEATGAVAGRSSGLNNTDNAWRPFEFEFTIPPGCGAVASLELDTLAPVDAAIGGRGRVWFDALALERLR